jgi:hypothetical protein
VKAILERASQIERVLENWLLGDYKYILDSAIEKTISDGLFAKSDVLFAINHVKNSVLNGEIVRWVDEVTSKSEASVDGNRTSNLIKSTTKIDKRVLCLHAGNLPLVGLQDLIATLASGHQYCGKLSSKDPWLLESLVKVFKLMGVEFQLETSTDIHHFNHKQFSKWMFSGSETSLKSIKPQLLSHQIILPQALSLMRVAHFSAAHIPDWNDECIPDLMEGMLRYRGKGCRSIAIVSTDVRLSEVKPQLEAAARVWYKRNGTSMVSSEIKNYRQAYNAAVGIHQVDIASHLIQEGIPTPDYPEIIYWIPLIKPEQLKITFGRNLQQVYSCSKPEVTTSSNIIDIEPVYLSQRPLIDWKPDQTDPLEWLFINKYDF